MTPAALCHRYRSPPADRVGDHVGERDTFAMAEIIAEPFAGGANRIRATESLFSRVANDFCNKIGH
jgi:hypothetical protein